MKIKEIEKNFPKKFTLKGSAELTVRSMQPSDQPDVLKFFGNIPEEDLTRANFFEPQCLDRWLEYAKEGKAIFLLGFVGKELAGVVSLHQVLSRCSEHVCDINLTIARNYRRKGIGSILSKEIYSIAMGEGFEKVCVIVSRENHSFEPFSNLLGFTQEAVLKGHGKDQHGRKFDLIVLSTTPRQVAEEISRYLSGQGMQSFD